MPDDRRRPRLANAWAPLLLLATCAAWAVVSTVEGAFSILLLSLLFVGAALVLIRLLPEPRTATRLFAVGLAVRTAFALAAWYTRGEGLAWSEGVGTDAIHYLNNSAAGLSDDLFLMYSHKGFIGYAAMAASLARWIDGVPIYLCSLQLTLVSGALFAPIVYGVMRMLRGRRFALAVAICVMLHPGQIAISSVLLRDAVVGCFGWLMVYVMMRARNARTVPAGIAWGALLVPVSYWVFILRSPSFVVFFGLGVALAWVSTRPGQRAPRAGRSVIARRAAVGAFAIGGVALVVMSLTQNPYLQIVLSSGRTQDILQTRLELSTSGSIAGQLLQYGWLPFAIAYIPLAFVMPFPFYSYWTSANPLGPPLLDMSLGLGGLVNQLLLGLFVIGVITAIRRRDRATIVAALFFPVFAFLVVATGGDTERYVLSHVFPLMAMVSVVGWTSLRRARIAVIGAWCACLIGLYAAYLALKLGTGAVLLLFALACLLGWMVAMLIGVAASPGRLAVIDVPARRSADS